MGASLFSIGLTGLNAAQAGLSTTSHNNSNAGTTGYSRQSIEQSTNPAMFTGAGGKVMVMTTVSPLRFGIKRAGGSWIGRDMKSFLLSGIPCPMKEMGCFR